jgi:poly-gamma-glutamate synthesis protein (capsule biosynthesis protein)
MIVAGFEAGFYWHANILFFHTTLAQKAQDAPAVNIASESAGEGLAPILEKINKEKIPQENILFLGDIMLDRGVEKLTQKYGPDYPFEKIKDFLSGFNIVSANLEGPIVAKPKDFGPQALQFAFASDSAAALKRNYINFVSLANNHLLNMGQEGLNQTKQFLGEQGIGFAGEPLKCGSDLSYQKDNLIFLSFNATYNFGCTNDEFIATIKKTKAENPDKFLVVNMHWGTEYRTVNSKTQENLAHALIEAGADLIIGHHPHVVENIELYKNKLIFYSLGNFIFDQYFNQNVQQGLAINLEIFPQKYIYKIFPLISEKGQPALMEGEAKNNFLNNLAAISSPDIKEQIKSSQIELKL